MGSRKKSKVNPALESESDTQSQKHTAQNDVTESAARQDYLQTEDTSEATRERTEPIKISRSHGPVAEAGGQSWYGSWKNKALPVTEVRRESISASPRPSLTSGSSKASIKYNSSGTGNASPHRYMSTGSLRGTKATPMEATTTNISITSKKSLKNETETVRNTSREASDPPIPPESSAKETYSKTSRSGTKQMAQNPIVSDTTEASTPIVGWLGGWWSRPDGFDDSKTKQTDNEAAVAAEAKNTPLPESVPVPKDSDRRTRSPDDPVLVNEESTRNVSTSEQKDKVPATTSKSWFSFWSTSQNAQIFETREETPEIGVHDTRTTSPNTDATRLATDGTDSDSKSIRSINATIKSVKDIGSRKASGWAFWSLGNTDPTVTINVDGMNKQVGELAVANTPSQSSPEQAQFNSSAVEDVPAESIKSSSSSAVSSKTRKTAVKSKNKIKQQEDTVEQITPLESSEPKVNKPPTKARDTKSSETTIALSKIDSHKSDIILPDLRKTYSVEQKHTMLQNLRHYVLGDGPQDHPHLHMVSSLPKIKKALAIGVHGFFPNSLFQKVMGAPTGTSIKFSNMAATAIKKWTQSQGYDCEIEKAALEGEGLIADRVDTLWKLLLNWIDHVRSADFVLFACHSQGVPVTVMLVDRLIKFGILSSKKVGICAMAGINLGPWKEYRTQLLGKSALELFDFASPSSKVSTSYRTALDQVLRHNVRITFVGSMDDQLVSLEVSHLEYNSSCLDLPSSIR